MKNEKLKLIYNEFKDLTGSPQIYKNIKFYPILIKDFYFNNMMNNLLAYPKDILSKTKEEIQMSYFKFLLFGMWDENDERPPLDQVKERIEYLCDFFKYVTKSENVFIDIPFIIKDKPNDPKSYICYLIVDGVKFNEKNFDLIGEMI